MRYLKKSYDELIYLMQLYLFQSHTSDEKLLVDMFEYEFFREWALKRKQPPSQASIQLDFPTPAKTVEMPVPAMLESRNSSYSPIQPHAKSQAAPALGTTSIQAQMQHLTSNLKPSEAIPPSMQPPESSTKVNLSANAEPSTQKKSHSFALELPSTLPATDFVPLKNALRECFPQFVFIDTIPDDREAILKAAQWKEKRSSPQLVILSFDESPKQHTFLSNLHATLEIHQMPCLILNAFQIEERREWDSLLSSPGLRLLIACNYQIQKAPGLMKHYREELKQATAYFGSIPALLLPDLSIYFKEPSLKYSLWKAILQRNA